VESGVAEDGVEFVFEREVFAVDGLRGDAEFFCGFDLGGAGVDAEDVAAEGLELGGEDAVTAAEIEDAFAGLRGEEIEDGSAEVGDEAGVAGVGFGVPGLGHFVSLLEGRRAALLKGVTGRIEGAYGS